ncbi:uncharacterized protein E0L32_011938 [Thyridium curvatum]|uniref:EGF domain-specific O-linked N-acetylglucosamine transferase n=1 Tax=Thyridium curvatum TaxID=1093900 RepID=A0A507BLC8_9PEZI|nr:uncharacterized protein E0L32_011938 [Thyridium curvatum]TPX17991.1 hypothetical protein E0L32_011938 [Thyridium curvatum]
MIAGNSLGNRRLFSLIFTLSFVALVVYTLSGSIKRKSYSRDIPDWLLPSTQKPTGSSTTSLSIPELDDIPPTRPGEPEFCVDRFSPRYLYQLRDHNIQYCTPESQARLTCFHSKVRDDDNQDSFCIGQGSVLDVSRKRFALDCNIRQPDDNETARGLLSFDRIKPHWYATGPKVLFDHFVDFRPTLQRSPEPMGKKKEFALLVKREEGRNLWHTLMEIWSMTMTFDTLRLSRDPNDDNKPFFESPEDVANTQIIVLDDHIRGSTFDLWHLFSSKPPLHLKEIVEDPVKAQEFSEKHLNIILPLPGGSNPLWQNDWVARDCTESPLLRLFVRRVFQHFGVEHATGPRPVGRAQDKDITLTFVDRRGSRRLLRSEALLDAARARFPNVDVRAVDLAALPLAEQLRIVQETDVLLGVHGAGLTHAMFMREGAGAVAEIQPAGLFHKGFRNLAAMTGHRYFSAHADMVLPGEEEEQGSTGGETGSAASTRGTRREAKRDEERVWQSANVRIEEERFLGLVEVAVKSLYNEGLRNHDVF